MRQTNQDYLFQQIAERNKNREKALEQKRQQKLQAQAASEEHTEAERRRVDEARTKYLQYRDELEKQMEAKREAHKAKTSEDQMTAAERAINRQLIKEAKVPV
mmetsp:Transcript_101160/g.198505  ORF Transcript_101160/g.198505 Transcript_101160/m.198505 type:complete len:103 (-) Transcript_101160:19-327(-)